MFVAAVAEYIRGLPRLARDLAAWDFGDGINRPAVFTTEPIPGEVGSPVIVLTQDGSSDNDDRSGRGGAILLQALLSGDKTGSDARIRALAMHLWEQLDRVNLEVEGYAVAHLLADAPVRVSDPDGYPAYRLGLTVVYSV